MALSMHSAHDHMHFLPFLHCSAVFLQSPLMTLMWVCALNSTLLPMVNFAIDTYGFCQKFSTAEGVLFSVYFSLCFLSVALGPAWFDVKDALKFYRWPLSFGWRLCVLFLGLMALYWSVLTAANFLWVRHMKRRQIYPVN